MTRSDVTELELASARRREVLAAARGTARDGDLSRDTRNAEVRATPARSLTDLTRALLGLPAQRA